MRRPRVKIRLILINLTLIALFVLLYFVDKTWRPMIYNSAMSETKIVLSNSINDAVTKVIGESEIDYSDIVNLTYDSNNNVKSITTDTSALNDFKSKFMTNYLTDPNKIVKFKINIGTLSGYSIFNSIGPDVRFHVELAQQPDADFVSTFEAQGINQTIHRIVFRISIEINFVFATGYEPDKIVTEYVMAESVIVGNVPNSYTNVIQTKTDGYDTAETIKIFG